VYLVVRKTRTFFIEVFINVAIPEESRCYWIEVVGVSAPSYIRLEVLVRFRRIGPVIILVYVFVVKL